MRKKSFLGYPQKKQNDPQSAQSLCGLSFRYYSLEDWPLLKASVIHYLIITLAFFPIGLYLGWMSPTLKDFLVIAVMLGIMNSIIWLTMYAVYHFEVEELNHLLKRNSDSEYKK